MSRKGIAGVPYALFGLITMLLWTFCIVDAITRDDADIQQLLKVRV